MDIWSNNKYLNICINILIFLVGINIFHYGQLLLPIICLLIFIENKLVFKVNSPFIFIILCLFGISFYAFSYQLGFYSVMGFTLPMAYYIGSNIKKTDKRKVIKTIYLLAIAMACHLLLNEIFEFIVHGARGFFYSSSHYDIWMNGKVSSTLIALDLDLMIACLYFLCFHERNKKIKIITLLLFAITMFYLLVIGRRTQLLMVILVFICSYIYDSLNNNSSKKINRYLLYAICTILILGLISYILYAFNLFGFRLFVDDLTMIYKIKQSFEGDQRIGLFINSIKLMPKYLFGGYHINDELGLPIHNFWLDIYDYAGIVPFILICIYSIYYLIVVVKIMKNNNIDKSFKVLVLALILVIFIQLNLEPAFTGASIFVIVCIIIGAALEGLINE